MRGTGHMAWLSGGHAFLSGAAAGLSLRPGRAMGPSPLLAASGALPLAGNTLFPLL